MKKFFYTIVIYFFLIISTNSNENKILIKLNDQIITSLDIVTKIIYLKSINKNLNNLEDTKVIELAKRSLIKEKIKKIKLKEIYKKIEIKKEFLDNIKKTNFRNLNINNSQEFDKYFFDRNIDPSYIEETITIEILWNQFIYKQFIKNVKIDKEKIIREIKNKNNSQYEYKLSEILFSINDNENIKKKYLKIKEDIKLKNFSEAANIHSISDSSELGGKLGWIKGAVLNENIQDEIEKIEINEITEPIIVPGGFLILYKEDQRNIKIDLDKEIETIIRQKTNEQLGQFSNILYNKTKKNIKINEL